MQFDFKGAQFDLTRQSDRDFLIWIMNQVLYGEVTGIQCGHWLYHAPHLNAAMFLARQATEELSHVKRFLRIISILDGKPTAAHPAIRFLSTGMMGGGWGEHVAIEMALGEGLVLNVFYVLSTIIPHSDIQKLIESSIADEQKHVEFGEKETLKWLERYPQDKNFFLGQALVQIYALKKLKGFVIRKVLTQLGQDHAVGVKFSEFYDFALSCLEKRLMRLGVLLVPLKELSTMKKVWLVFRLPLVKLVHQLRRSKKLTQIYLNDPVVLNEKAPLSTEKGF